MADDLTPADYAFLILLQIEGRDISNSDLDKAHGVRLIGKEYARLKQHGYVDSHKVGSTYWLQLSEGGAKLLGDRITISADGAKKTKETPLWAALSALHAVQVGRPRGAQGLEQRIRAAYAELATSPGAWVSLTRLRPSLDDVPKAELDKALERLLDAPDVELEPEDNQKTLKVEDRRAAVRIGGEDRHLLAIGMR
jgi:hypothetical protein